VEQVAMTDRLLRRLIKEIIDCAFKFYFASNIISDYGFFSCMFGLFICEVVGSLADRSN